MLADGLSKFRWSHRKQEYARIPNNGSNGPVSDRASGATSAVDRANQHLASATFDLVTVVEVKIVLQQVVLGVSQLS